MVVRRIVVFLCLSVVVACGDPPAKTDRANASTPANSQVGSDLSAYCAQNLGEYTCADDGFSIMLLIDEGCGELGQYAEECDLTPARIEACRAEIDACPAGFVPEESFPSCDFFGCLVVQAENNASNGVANNTTNNSSTMYTAQFRAVADLLRQNCALAGCHGNPPGSTEGFFVPTGVNATDEEIEASLMSSSALVVPGMPEDSLLWSAVADDSGLHAEISEVAIEPLYDWIADGAVYRE